MTSVECRCWAWKRRKRWACCWLALIVLASGAVGDSIASIEPAYDCVNGRGNAPVVAITFNGGPNEWTAAILKVLRAANVVATFFVEPELFISSATLQQTLQQMVADGHTVACHASGARDNDFCRQQLVKVIGYHPVLRRPLGLDAIVDEVTDARSNGQVVTLWNYDFGDWDSFRTESTLVQQYRYLLAMTLNRTSDSGVGIGRRYGSFIVVLQNGDRIVRSYTTAYGTQTTMLAEILNESIRYTFVSMADCLKVKAYSAYSTPDQTAGSASTSHTVLFAIVFAGLFGVLAIAAVLYTSARRKLHQKARQKEEQRELSRAAIGVMVSQGLFKGDRRDFEQSVPEDSEDRESDAQRLRHLTPTGIVRTPPMKRTKKDFHDLKTSHYSMAVNPHGRARKQKNQPARIVYDGKKATPAASSREKAYADANRRLRIRRNSDPIFGSEEEVLPAVEVVASRPGHLPDDFGSSGVYRPPVRTAPLVLPFQQPFDYGTGTERRKRSARALSSGSITGSGTFLRRKRRVEYSEMDDDDDLDADFHQDFIGRTTPSSYV